MRRSHRFFTVVVIFQLLSVLPAAKNASNALPSSSAAATAAKNATNSSASGGTIKYQPAIPIRAAWAYSDRSSAKTQLNEAYYSEAALPAANQSLTMACGPVNSGWDRYFS